MKTILVKVPFWSPLPFSQYWARFHMFLACVFVTPLSSSQNWTRSTIPIVRLMGRPTSSTCGTDQQTRASGIFPCASQELQQQQSLSFSGLATPERVKQSQEGTKWLRNEDCLNVHPI